MNYYKLIRYCEDKSFSFCKRCPYKEKCREFREKFKTIPVIMHDILSQEFEKDK